MTNILLVGNPNCGKTTLFNSLTGDNQRVGNWPGVTVEKKTGTCIINNKTINITDLPGVYSLAISAESYSQDAQITAHAIITHETDLILNVLDACHLERHLYLTSQLLELNIPLILVINMTDIAKQRGIAINAEALSLQLKCPVFMIQAHQDSSLVKLKQAIIASYPASLPLELPLPHDVETALSNLEQILVLNSHKPICAPYTARRIFEGDTMLMRNNNTIISHNLVADSDVLMADARYTAIHNIVIQVQQKKSDVSDNFTAKLDKIVLHRFWALPIFFGMMYLLFFFAINVGGAFQDFFNITTDAVFVQGSAYVLQKCHAPDWLVALCANGIGKGINTTLTFIPVMASMYFFLALLEASGYMARAAFVVDRVMRKLGLPGKSFVPMIVGFGCNVPAILAARTLDSERERLLTVLMSPFMSCSARLAIYAVFVAAFFPVGGQNVVFSLYLIGIVMAVFTGFVLRKTLLPGPVSPLILELPAYHQPSCRRLFKETGYRLRFFITRAGKFIIPVCVVLGGLNALSFHGNLHLAHAAGESILTSIGQWFTPVFAPMGLRQDNWPATVGLLTGALAKEVVIGSLNTLYAQMGHLVGPTASGFNFLSSIQEALLSIPNNFIQLGHSILNPMLSAASNDIQSTSVYGIMYAHFDGKIGAYAYLLFILLYIPCVSTMAAIRQESTPKLMWFSILWSLGVAYAVAVSFYQTATFFQHPEQTLGYLLGIILIIGLTLALIYSRSLPLRDCHATNNS